MPGRRAKPNSGRLCVLSPSRAKRNKLQPSSSGTATAQAPTTRKLRKERSRSGDVPRPLLASARTLVRRQSEEGGELRSLASWILAILAEAITGSTPGMVINGLAPSSALTDAASLLVNRSNRLDRAEAREVGTRRLRPKAGGPAALPEAPPLWPPPARAV
jgi:hypothetical protein